MGVHPPLLYLGYVGMTVPFAFAIGALAGRRLDDSWIRLTRRWTIVAWTSSRLAIVAGMWWSYEVLGWGGYWAWDPVENASFMPWLTATALPALGHGAGTPGDAQAVEPQPDRLHLRS
jgi:cytochrome c-type biogenesis protein CcmF